jgi:hypothetical protein
MSKFVVIAAVLQVLMVVTGHFNEFVLLNLSAVLGVGIPFVVAFFFGRGCKDMKESAKGGLAIGFIGAALGIGLAIVMGDQTLMLLALGPLSSAVTGAIGGVLGFKV